MICPKYDSSTTFPYIGSKNVKLVSGIEEYELKRQFSLMKDGFCEGMGIFIAPCTVLPNSTDMYSY